METTLLPRKIKELNIPRAILENDKHRALLNHTVERFGHEEKLAIHYCAVTDVTIDEVSEAVDLSHDHVASTLLLFSERLKRKLAFLQSITPHDEKDIISLEEMLFNYCDSDEKKYITRRSN